MDYQFNLTWWQARDLARTGQWIRRWDWTDRWIFASTALWWMIPNAGEARVLLASDLTRIDLLAGDWTTTWADQQPCIVPPPEDPEEPPPPPPPPPDPDPNPGGSTKLAFKFFSAADQRFLYFVYGLRTVTNPFALPVLVHVTGLADGPLVIYDVIVAQPLGPYAPVTVDHRFILLANESFTFGTYRSGNGDTGYDLTFTFTA